MMKYQSKKINQRNGFQMKPNELENFTNDLLAYFNQKVKPLPATGRLWFDEIQNIPSESLPFIFSSLKKKESFPKNLPSIMWALFYQWRNENPDKKAFNDCQECEGTGWIIESNKAYRCGSCDNAPREAYFNLPHFSGMAKIKTRRKFVDDWHDQF